MLKLQVFLQKKSFNNFLKIQKKTVNFFWILRKLFELFSVKKKLFCAHEKIYVKYQEVLQKNTSWNFLSGIFEEILTKNHLNFKEFFRNI